jgi:alpha-tubulin suppressor-like RCC1 family protein
MKTRLLMLAVVFWMGWARAAGLIWPAGQLLPAFSPPVPVLDCIDVSSASSAEIDLFASLEGLVNRTQPQIICVSSANGEGAYTWLILHNQAYVITNGYSALLQFRTNVTGLVVTDPNLADTLNLATTMAGVNNELICNPSLLATLTNAPYSLPIVDDLRGRFADKYAVYGWLYTNYWPQCTHRVIAGLETNLDGNLRDYLVAVKSATVWLDPGTARDAALLGQFLGGMTAGNGVYIGWWPSEGNGLTWIASYGIPVLASDYYGNGSYFSAGPRTINVPPIPPPPPLQNKVYVALILSDGDNVQYMQHVMKMDWDGGARGSVPIGWTTSALAADLDPVMLNYYWSTATTNDCLISGPCGAGYAHLELWNSANLASLATTADAYLQRSGLRVITVWDRVTSGIARAYATNCPTLLGLTDQNGTYNAVDLGLRTIGLTPTYASTTNQMISAITNAAAGWNGTAPLFILAQAVVWSLGPADLANIARTFNTNEFQFVRPDHLFMLNNRAFGPPAAVTQAATTITAGSATLQGTVGAQGTNTGAWFEWGTNINYGFQTAVTNPAGAGNPAGLVKAGVSGLKAGQIYHYQLVASNLFGTTSGGDKQFTTGGHAEVWGGGTLGETNVPAGLTNVVGISAGVYHALALRNDGTVAAWGYNNFKQTNVPAGLTNVVAVAGGVQHSLALLANGTVTAWGDNTYGQTNVPGSLTNVTAIAAGGFHNLALKADQTVTAWGYNNFGQTNVPAGLSNVVAVAAGYYHSVALKADGTVASWGAGSLGQTNVPAGLNHVLAVSAGQYHSVALKAAGNAPANLVPASRWAADSLSGTNGATVGLWLDGVGGKSAAQAVPGNQPLLYTNVFNRHNAVRFAGGQYLTVAAADSLISGATDFTLAVVFRTATPGNVSSSFFQNTGLLGAEQPGVVTDWALCVNGSQLGAGLGAGSGCSADESLYGGNVTDGSPHIAMYVRTGGTIRLYVDGAIVAEQTALCLAARGSYPFQIGAMTTTSDFFTGDLAEIQLYKRALSPWEVMSVNEVLAATYTMSGIAGAAANRWLADSLTGTNGAAVSVWTDVVAGKNATQTVAGNRPVMATNVINGHKTVHFSSGSSQYLTVAAADSPISSAGSFTMVVVFKTSTPGNSSSSFFQNTGLLGAEQPNIVNDWAFCLNGSQLGAGLGAGTGGCGADLGLYGGNVTDGNPHVAMYVRAGDTITLYVDGAIVAMQDSLCTEARGNYPFQIGAMTTTSYFLNGDIAEIQLYSRALNSLEIVNVNEALAATYDLGGAAGTVVVWGNNSSGQADVPAGLTNVWAVASGGGSSFNLALMANGTVQGWGANSQGQTNVPAGLTNVAAIAAGSVFGLAIGNQPPVAGNPTVSGYVNHDLVLALPAVSPDGSPLNFQILTLPAAGTLYQYSAGVRGPAISATNTPVSDAGGQVIFAPGAGQTGNPYASFAYLANDGVYSSSPAAVTVDIGLPIVPQFTGGDWNPGAAGAGSFVLNFSGATNASYSVWAATNLINWVNLGIATEAPPGQYQFTDETVTNWPQRFYQLSAP